MPTGPLTIYNTLSVSDIIYDKAGNSVNWNNTHTNITANSGNWQSTYSTVSTLSVAWDDTINVKSYGAKGDGVTDDTAAIQTAISNNPHKIIYFPKGNYFISSTIIIDNPIQLRGNRAWTGSQITWGSKTLSAFRVTSAGGVIVDGMYFQGAANATAGYVFNFEGGQTNRHNRGSKIINSHFVNGYTCVYTVSAATFNIDRVTFSNYSNTGVVVQNLRDPDSGDSSITNSIFTTDSLSAIGILQYSSGGLRINNNKILSGKHAYKMEYSGDIPTADLLFCDNSVENQNDTSIFITNKSLSGKFNFFCITGNQFANMPKVITLSANRTNCFYRGVIGSNTIRTNGTAPHEGIRLQNVSYINVVGNTIETPLGEAIIFESGCRDCTYSDNNIPNSSIQISNSSNSIGSTANFSTSTTTYNNSVSATNLYARTSILSSGIDLKDIFAPITHYSNLTGNWQSTYTTMTANSANWQSTYTTMTANSANWQSTYTTMTANSANWQSTYTTMTANSANWQSTYTTMTANSANWQSTYTTMTANSANWQSTYTTMTANSANWNLGYEGYTVLNSNSANWVRSYFGDFNDGLEKYAYYGNYNTGFTPLFGPDGESWTRWFANFGTGILSGVSYDNGFQIYVNPNEIKKIYYNGTQYEEQSVGYLSNSRNWDSVFATVSTLSASWEESAVIIPTVTNYLSTNNVLISSATITSRLRVNSDVLIYGNLSATGTSTFANTIFTTTTAISVVNVGSGTAMWVGNNGVGDIASFYDIDQNVEVLHIGGENSLVSPGVGVRTSYPNKALTVNGEISANNIIYDANGNSLNWNRGYAGYSSLTSLSANWQSTYTTMTANSANWQSTYTTMTANSANWQSTYTTMTANSANWNTVYSTVCALSTAWEESADILPTVTNYLSTNNVLLSSATVIDSISARGSVAASQSIIPVTVTNISADKTFTDTDTNKIFHFDTTSGALTASFPGVLSDGFNAGIMNTGTNYLYISSNIQYNAVGNKLIDRYSGAYVYKSNSNIFAVGGV